MGAMTQEEREVRSVLSTFGHTLARAAMDETWSVADLVRHLRMRADLAEAHARQHGFERRQLAKEEVKA